MATQVFKGADGQFYFRIKGSNGEVIATSEGYTRKQDAERGLEGLMQTVESDRKSEVEPESFPRIHDSVSPTPQPNRRKNDANMGSLTFDPGLA